MASDIVLRSIKEAVPSTWPAKVAELRRIAQGRESVSLAHYLEESGSDLDDVYSNGRSWSDLRAAAGLPQQAPGPEEQNLRRACGRLLHIDDMERIEGYRRLLANAAPPPVQVGPNLGRRVADAADRPCRQVHSPSEGEAISQRCGDVTIRHAEESADVRFKGLQRSARHEENRIPPAPVAIGLRGGRLHVLCFAETPDGIRVISFRKANPREVSRYGKKKAAD